MNSLASIFNDILRSPELLDLLNFIQKINTIRGRVLSIFYMDTSINIFLMSYMNQSEIQYTQAKC